MRYGEQLLKEADDKTHPVHLAYLNFYTALSHDTLARQATLKNRCKELNAAEKHYMAAIEVLTPSSACSSPPSSDDEQPLTPDSATLPDEAIWQRHSYNLNTMSIYSTNTYRTSMSSITSYAWELEQDPDSALNDYSFPTPPPKERDLRRDSRRDSRGDLGAIYKHYSRHMKSEGYLSSSPRTSKPLPKPAPLPVRLPPSTSSFILMVKGHLTSVRGLKENTAVHGVRFALDSPTQSPKAANFRFRDSGSMDRETLWQRRKKVFVRAKRFDAESIQQLCKDALAEIP
ncbi:atp synthase gamma subunit [Pyrenophora seminiperda CCB06]|uniref:Atp synthase gamma subunit n=1 Tax=Pyrenophora seminiperda CCB06 TaxID=1302712 RepID=A0A3M7LWM6_9PLEO|nr:atp synthase gamma subunit [Pyrenophora seminiperda CCB06]